MSFVVEIHTSDGQIHTEGDLTGDHASRRQEELVEQWGNDQKVQFAGRVFGADEITQVGWRDLDGR